MTAVKAAPMESERTQFRTQLVNGKPQIYFDALDESPAKPKPKRPISSTRLPEQPKAKSISSQKTAKPTKKNNKVTFDDSAPTNGVFMTMEEISELVKAVKETTTAHNSSTEHVPPPPPPPPHHPEPVPSQSLMEVPRIEIQTPLAPISPRQEALGLMAEKKRQKWMREKAEMDRMKLEVEYDQLKHQLSPVHQKASSSPEQSTMPTTDTRPPLPPSGKQTDNELAKTRLMEKKQQQWRQENAEKAPVWNPFGRPGAGAPNANELPSNTFQQPPSNPGTSSRPTESSFPSNIILNDQTRVPAAMRTNLLFGDVRFEDDVKTAKEIERRQWLDDLQKQIEDNKRQRSTQQESERRQDFLQENIQPLIQEAASRHTDTESTPAPSNRTGRGAQKSTRHDSVVKQTYDKIVEATELAKYEKKAQLIEKLKRNGHQTDLLAKTLPHVKATATVTVQKPVEKPHENSPKKTTSTSTSTKVEPLQLNDTRRDEAVNTIDSTFRSETSVQTDLRIPQHKQLFTFTREESDLPPQIPSHLLRNTKPIKKNVRIRSLEDPQRQRQSQMQHTFRDDSTPSQRSQTTGPVDIVHRPLWNYQNRRHREYVPNSKKYPPRARQPGHNTSFLDETPKKAMENRWYSDSEIQREQREKRAAHPPAGGGGAKANHSKDDTIISLFKVQKPKQETFILTRREDEAHFNVSSLDKYEHFTPYIRTDEILDPAKAFSPVPLSRETSAHRPRVGTIAYHDQYRRQDTMVQPAPYHVPPSRQEHILQQLTAIKENLVRRQQEVATSMNAIPV